MAPHLQPQHLSDSVRPRIARLCGFTAREALNRGNSQQGCPSGRRDHTYTFQKFLRGAVWRGGGAVQRLHPATTIIKSLQIGAHT